MLVLSRKDSEQIVIDDRICIKVLSIRGNSVRLGIDAPPSVAVLRGEIAVELEETQPEMQTVPFVLGDSSPSKYSNND